MDFKSSNFGARGRTLQLINWTSGSFQDDLYYHHISKSTTDGDNSIIVNEGGICSFNSYFASFYEAYWLKYTDIHTAFLEIEGSGEMEIAIYRDHPHGCRPVLKRKFDLGDGGVAQIDLEFPRGASEAGGRLFVDVLAPESEESGAFHVIGCETGTDGNIELKLKAGPSSKKPSCAVKRMRWGSDQLPQRDVRLGIGFCTFNRESDLLNTLERVVSYPFHQVETPKVVIVNQGPDFSNAALQALLQVNTASCRLVSQGNFGGAGGFTRAILETLGDKDITHVLLMDDDISLHTESINNAAIFMSYCSQDAIIGGTFFDLLRPHLIFESGTQMRSDNELSLLQHNLVVSDTNALTPLSKVSDAHYCGWWFCAIPRSCFEKFGLPEPVFIHGDDLEFGIRCTSKGVPSIALPGLCVWHAPIYAKAPGWQIYYDVRNRLIFNSHYRDISSIYSSKYLRRRILMRLAMADYQEAWLIIRAIEDFLKGPQILLNCQEIHQTLMKDLKAYAPDKVWHSAGTPPISHRGHMSTIRRKLRFAKIFWQHKHDRLPYKDRRLVLVHDRMVSTVGDMREYLLTDATRAFTIRYRYNRDAIRGLWAIAKELIQRYEAEHMAVADQWNAAKPELNSEAYWRKLLKM